MTISIDTIEECKHKLLEAKSDILNRSLENSKNLNAIDTSGDEADQSTRNVQENQSLGINSMLRTKLLQIEAALAKIERGNYGICEETGESIESARLIAIPWTKLSIEGAEQRGAMNKKYAK